MVGGQHVDLEAAGRDTIDAETLEYIQTRKTGSLFAVAATIGGALLGAPEDRLEVLAAYARSLGFAYQITDDILDVTGDPSVVGKDVGQDAGKKTFVTLYGVDAAREAAGDLLAAASEALEGLDGDVDILRGIAEYCLERSA